MHKTGQRRCDAGHDWQIWYFAASQRRASNFSVLSGACWRWTALWRRIWRWRWSAW